MLSAAVYELGEEGHISRNAKGLRGLNMHLRYFWGKKNDIDGRGRRSMIGIEWKRELNICCLPSMVLSAWYMFFNEDIMRAKNSFT